LNNTDALFVLFVVAWWVVEHYLYPELPLLNKQTQLTFTKSEKKNKKSGKWI